MEFKTFILHSLLPFVRAVVGSSEDGVAEFVGSGFLLKNDGNLFLITAAHVMDCQSNSYQLFIDRPDEGFVRINGEGIVSRSNDQRRKDDRLDIAIVSLSA